MFGKTYNKRKLLETVREIVLLLRSGDEMAFDGSIPYEVAADLEIVLGQMEQRDKIDKSLLTFYFAPTSLLQECAMANDWHDEYMGLATKFDSCINGV